MLRSPADAARPGSKARGPCAGLLVHDGGAKAAREPHAPQNKEPEQARAAPNMPRAYEDTDRTSAFLGAKVCVRRQRRQ